MHEPIIAVYRYSADSKTAEARARDIAIEQSVEMPVAAISDRYVLDEVLGEVVGVHDLGSGRYEARIALSSATVGSDAGQLLNVLFGNTSLHDDVILHDAEFPPSIARAFGGPKLGIAGWRRRVSPRGRPITLTNLKPQGLAPADLARLAGDLAAGGVDLIKDDHGLADQAYSPFAERAPRIADAVCAASRRTGVATRYLPHVTGSLDGLRTKMEIVRRSRLDGVLALPMVIGFPTFQVLRAENPDIAFIAHPAMAGATRIAPALLMGRLFRLIGADATVFPNYGGRFGVAREECLRLALFAREPWLSLPPALPIPSGGMTVERVNELARVYGVDVGMFLGGSLLASATDMTRAAAAFVAAVDAVLKNPASDPHSVPVEEAAVGGEV